MMTWRNLRELEAAQKAEVMQVKPIEVKKPAEVVVNKIVEPIENKVVETEEESKHKRGRPRKEE